VNSYDKAAGRRAAACSPDDVDAQGKVADLDLATGRIEDVFDRLLGVIRRTCGEDRDQARLLPRAKRNRRGALPAGQAAADPSHGPPTGPKRATGPGTGHGARARTVNRNT